MRSESTDLELKRARRRFLANCGKFAVATPPAITLLLAASKANYAVASSGGTGGGGSSASPPQLSGDPPPTTGSTVNASGTNNAPTNPTGGVAAGQSCGNTFEALWNNDKCIR